MNLLGVTVNIYNHLRLEELEREQTPQKNINRKKGFFMRFPNDVLVFSHIFPQIPFISVG